MDLFGAITVLAALNGVERDNRDPFELMPKNIKSITLKHRNKTVDILRTVENLFNNPEFICSDIEKFWKNVEKDPKGYVMNKNRISINIQHPKKPQNFEVFYLFLIFFTFSFHLLKKLKPAKTAKES